VDRERAETFLRLLAEAELRDPLPPPRHAGGATDFPFFSVPAPVRRAAWALTAVQALDVETADSILTDMELALAMRQQQEPTEPGQTSIAPSHWLRRLTAPHQRSWLYSWYPPASQHQAALKRFVPLVQKLAFQDDATSAEVQLLSFAQTTSGARFAAVWRKHDALGWHMALPPADQFAVTDDRGTGYELGVHVTGVSAASGILSLHPAPPDDLRWLDITAPGEPAVRVDLTPGPAASAGCTEPVVSTARLSVGEHVLNGLASQLISAASAFPRDLRLGRPARSPGPLTSFAAGLGAVIAALEAAGALSPLSPVPGRLAALCARLRVSGHGITAAPAHHLPGPLAYRAPGSHAPRRRGPGAHAAAGSAAHPLRDVDRGAGRQPVGRGPRPAPPALALSDMTRSQRAQKPTSVPPTPPVPAQPALRASGHRLLHDRGQFWPNSTQNCPRS
jgi:hypothetical protein